jgi:hypothetical protein
MPLYIVLRTVHTTVHPVPQRSARPAPCHPHHARVTGRVLRSPPTISHHGRVGRGQAARRRRRGLAEVGEDRHRRHVRRQPCVARAPGGAHADGRAGTTLKVKPTTAFSKIINAIEVRRPDVCVRGRKGAHARGVGRRSMARRRVRAGAARALRAGRSDSTPGTFKFVHEGKRIGPTDTPEEVRPPPRSFPRRRSRIHPSFPSPPLSYARPTHSSGWNTKTRWMCFWNRYPSSTIS